MPKNSVVKRAQVLVLLKDRAGGQQTAHYEAVDTELDPSYGQNACNLAF